MRIRGISIGFLSLLVVVASLAAAPAGAGTDADAGSATPMGGVPPDPTVRREVNDLTEAERDAYVDAILDLKATPSPYDATISWYDQFVRWHRNAFKCSNDDAAHMSPAFLPWHRQYLKLFEEALRTVSGDDAIAIPYWDWTDPNSTATVFSGAFMGGDGDGNHHAVTRGPFRRGSWEITVFDPKSTGATPFPYLRRNFGNYVKSLPSTEQVHASFTRPEYDLHPFNPGSDPKVSMRNFLEGWRGTIGDICEKGWMDPLSDGGPPRESQMHNRVHLWVGGTLALNTSPNDPVFWLHHANVDRLWSQWEQIHGNVYRPNHGAPFGQNIDDTMWPYRDVGLLTTIRDTLDLEAFGCRYAVPRGDKIAMRATARKITIG